MVRTTLAVPSSRVRRPDPAAGPASVRAILWRLHFLSGFLAAPLVVWLCVTGILFAWNPQIESVLYREALTAKAEGRPRPLWEQVAAVTGRYPGHHVVEVRPAAAGSGGTTGVVLKPVGAEPGPGFAPAAGAFTAYVDPVSATVTGRIHESRRPDEWLRNLHSNFRLGEGGLANTLTELAGSLVLVSLVTGLYLWWPTTPAARRRALRPRPGGPRGGGRRAWRHLHATTGVLTSGAVAVLVVTGLTWTDYAGRWVDVAKDRLMPAVPTLRTDVTGSAPAGGSHGGHGDHSRHQAGTDSDGTSASTGPSVRLDHLARVVTAADDAGLVRPYTVTPPEIAGQAWTVTDTDTRWPIRETSVAVDPGNGTVIDRLRFADRPLLDQATTIGIAFHQAELFGLANRVGLSLLAVALIVLVISGYAMWWRRRPAGALAVPPRVGPLLRAVPLPLVALFALALVLLPTLAMAFGGYLVTERAVRSVRSVRSVRHGRLTP